MNSEVIEIILIFLGFITGMIIGIDMYKSLKKEKIYTISAMVSEELDDFIKDFGTDGGILTDSDIKEIYGKELAEEYKEFVNDIVTTIIEKKLFLFSIKQHKKYIGKEYSIQVIKPTQEHKSWI